jgi:hypothetical protein
LLIDIKVILVISIVILELRKTSYAVLANNRAKGSRRLELSSLLLLYLDEEVSNRRLLFRLAGLYKIDNAANYK